MELIELGKLIALLGSPLFAGGAAYGASKAALNGTRNRVKHLEESDEKQNAKLEELGRGVVRIETKQDMMLDYLKERKNG